MSSPPAARLNHRGSPRNCNRYQSVGTGEEQEEVNDMQELSLGKATNRRRDKSQSPSSTRSRGQSGRVFKRGSATKKGDRRNRNDTPEDADGGPSNSGGRGGMDVSGSGAPAGQGGGYDKDEGVPFKIVTRGKGKKGDDDSKMWYWPSPLKRKDFARGQVWNVPYHMPNLDSRIDSAAKADQYVKMTFARAVHSKYRHVVVLWRFRDKMIVVPIYSFDGDGISRKSPEEQTEMMEMMNHNDNSPPKGTGGNKVLRVKMNGGRELTKSSCARLTAAFSVDYEVYMTKVGNSLPASIPHLLKAMDDLIARSKSEPI